MTNKILNLTPGDPEAFHCKVVCLLQLQRFEDVLKQMEDNEHLGVELSFERAYALYRLNRVEEALRVLDGVAKQDLRAKELRAQVLYRLESYEECLALYRDLVKNTSDDFEMERLTNLSAVSSYLSQNKVRFLGSQLLVYTVLEPVGCHLHSSYSPFP